MTPPPRNVCCVFFTHRSPLRCGRCEDFGMESFAPSACRILSLHQPFNTIHTIDASSCHSLWRHLSKILCICICMNPISFFFFGYIADCLVPHIHCGSYCNEAAGTSLRECTCGWSRLRLWGILAGLWMPALWDYFFFLDQYYSSMSLTLPPNVFFCDPENAAVNWCFDQDKGSGIKTPNVLWDVKGFSGSRGWM